MGEEGHSELPTNSEDSSTRGNDELRMFRGTLTLGNLIDALEAYDGSPVISVRFLLFKKFTVYFSCILGFCVTYMFI